MSFLADISGTKGENLASALLAYLLRRSDRVRQVFVDKVAAVSTAAPIIISKQFAVFTEVATSDNRRVDLLLQTDNSVIGVENKFSAGFQEGQPGCYLKLVKKVSKRLGKTWKSDFQPILVVLAPDRRRKDAKEEIESQGIESSCFFVAWEELLLAMTREKLPDIEHIDRFLIDELSRYVETYTGSLDLTKLIEHLSYPWQPRGSAVVKSFFDTVIWPLLDETLVARYNYCGAAGYHGYYLSVSEDAPSPWIGFVNSEDISEIDRPGATFLVAFRAEEVADRFCGGGYGQRVTIDKTWSGNRFYPVAVAYKADWIKRGDWEQTLSVINDTLVGGR